VYTNRRPEIALMVSRNVSAVCSRKAVSTRAGVVHKDVDPAQRSSARLDVAAAPSSWLKSCAIHATSAAPASRASPPLG